MSLLPAHRRHSLFPDLTDWFAGFPTVENVRPFVEGRLIRVEDETADGKYLVRAELPGLDPDKDVTVTVHDGLLTIKAERSERQETKGRTEFSYGSFVRSVALPEGANEDDIAATYEKGILTIAVPLVTTEAAEPKRVSITSVE
ncbi:Hsp20/alpha crystallin family protein [Nocardia sp. NPDC005366]|uniref:Hsp20/alpha crystallin family protein n=1 Tax=Nocardia sp. NPDC005366 TaxID=3156878 RepID=UPI0033AF448F